MNSKEHRVISQEQSGKEVEGPPISRLQNVRNNNTN